MKKCNHYTLWAVLLLFFACLPARAQGWSKMPNSSTFQGNGQDLCPPNGYGGYGYNFDTFCDTGNGVFEDWTSFIYDQQNPDGPRAIIGGGGHAGYLGNEIYSLDFKTGQAYRLTNPSDPPSGCSSTSGTNIPNTASHNYGMWTSVPSRNWLVAWIRLGAQGGSPTTACAFFDMWALDLSTVKVSCAAPPGATPTSSGGCTPTWHQLTPTGLPTTATQAISMADYDYANQRMYVMIPDNSSNSCGVGYVDFNLDSWSSLGGPGPTCTIYGNFGIDQKQQAGLWIGGSFDSPNVGGTDWIDLASGTWHSLSVDSSCTTIAGASNPALVWDSLRQQLIGYVGGSGNSGTIWVITLNKTAGTITCTSETYGSTPGSDQPEPNNVNGGAEIFNKIAFDPIDNYYVVWDNSNTVAWKLTRPILPWTITPSSNGTNVPRSYTLIAADGDVPNYPQVEIAGSLITTQADVKNRWPDGSCKLAIVSWIDASETSGTAIPVYVVNQSSGNNTGYLTQTQMLGAGYNFDGQFQLSGTHSPTVSARTILSDATSIVTPTSGDIDSTLSTSGDTCAYWLQGAIVTAVVCADRVGRSFDVNTDNATGDPLHPEFEAWFWPQTDQVELGYLLEDDWASTTGTSSARDQTYSLTITGGDTSPTTLYTASSFTQTPRTAIHQRWCINGTNAGTRDTCSTGHVDHNWGYLAHTKFFPAWDQNLQIASTKIASEVSGFSSANQGPMGNSNGIGYWPVGFDATGAGEPHGPLPTWDIIYLMSQCDSGNSTTALCGNGSSGDMRTLMLRNSDLAFGVPVWYREADASAGHGGTFLSSSGSTQGRVVSINARTQVNLGSAASDQGSSFCPTNYSTDWINFGTGGEDMGSWDITQLDSSHQPNFGYVAYLLTGEYQYYYEIMAHAAYTQGQSGSPNSSGSTRACVSSGDGGLRQGSAGYWTIDQERENTWKARDISMAAFIGLDSSLEKTYFNTYTLTNIAVWEGSHNLTNDLGSVYNTPWSFGNTTRYTFWTTATGTTLGSWTEGVDGSGGYQTNAPLNQSGSDAPLSANANFQQAYSVTVVNWINQFGFMPGSCQLCLFVANRGINIAQDPSANVYNLSDYVYPTLNNSGGQIPSWSNNQTFYATQPSSWVSCSAQQDIDEGYQEESLAGVSFAYLITSNESYYGAASYNTIRNGIYATGLVNNCTGYDFASGSPKWDIVPISANLQSTSTTLSPSSYSFGNVNVGSSSSAVIFTLTNNNATEATSISPTVTGGNSGDFSVTNSGSGSCSSAGGDLTQGQSCTFTVVFTPSAASPRTTTLSVSYSGGDGDSSQTSSLSGTGLQTSSVVLTLSGTLKVSGKASVGP